mmetsp:Transcript_18155/g.31936  ORF Transcript_18155/g.31936 Transcript_18155/m.31936 type:complete len:122 (-) Transcript_18155:346-711(-)
MSKQDNESNIPKKDHPLMPPPPACYAEAVDVQGTGLSSLVAAAELVSHTASKKTSNQKSPNLLLTPFLLLTMTKKVIPDDVHASRKLLLLAIQRKLTPRLLPHLKAIPSSILPKDERDFCI